MLGLGVAQALTDVVGLPCVSFDSSSLFFSVTLFYTQFTKIPTVEFSRVDVFVTGDHHHVDEDSTSLENACLVSRIGLG